MELKVEPDTLTEGYLSSDSSLSSHSTSGASSCRTRDIKDKICGVCGDKALGYNFDAISCESCKAFFRRNAPKGIEYFRCPYDEKCSMDASNRRFCKRCRLKKCFEIGMKKEYILTDEEKAQKRQKKEENRVLRALERQAISNLSGEVTSQTTVLGPEDAEAIDEILVAYHKSLQINTEKDPPRDRANFSDLVNIAELSVRRVIAMAKQIKAFKTISQTDQIHLLKGGSIELLILRSVLTFDKDKQHFLDPVDSEETKAMNVEQLKMAESGTGLFEAHMRFVRSLAIDLKADETMLILLLVISLFSPDRDNLVDKELISAQQEKYSTLLWKYLLSRYPYGYAKTLLPRLLMKLTDIRNLNEEHSQVLLKVNTDGIQPLMKEVLDLTF